MNRGKVSEELVNQTIHFHGHSCPGLALGIRAAEFAMSEFGRSQDEEIVAVVETDMCGVDAIQYLLGCTFGKGNLIHLDYGKNAFTFHRRSDGHGFRITTRPQVFYGMDEGLQALRKKSSTQELTPEEATRFKEGMVERIKRIMEADLDVLFEVKNAQGPIPRKARIMDSLVCEACGELTMETRVRRFRGQTLCIPCFDAAEKSP